MLLKGVPFEDLTSFYFLGFFVTFFFLYCDKKEREVTKKEKTQAI